ncbi:hypothetical protein [Halorubrum salinum]|uniref:hypothetical protein n=1 Tax=Halorubrum salinum TaxID=767517 RepID=UPI0021121DB2|nr:hypothetical protein [Halorubrum salinum]
MARDLQFEVQYLLSLTLVVFGLLSADAISRSINNWIGLSVVLLLAVYFSLFNILYSFEQSTSIEIDFIRKMNQYARPVLLVLSAIFAYFVAHTIAAVVLDIHLIAGIFTSSKQQIIIKYVVPFAPIGVITMVINLFLVGPIKKYEDITTKVIPNSIRVFQSQSGTQPLTIKIENDGEETIPWELSIETPEDVSLNADATRDGELEPHRAFRETFELSHSAETRRSDVLKVNIDFEDASRQEEVELRLEF